MDVTTPGQAPSYSAPDNDIPENQKTASWYAQNIRYLSRFYNASNNILLTDDLRNNQLPVQKGLSMFLYYSGHQQNIDYSYSTKDLSNNTLPSVWIPGKKVRSLIDYILGSLKEQMNQKIIGATTLSKRAVSTKTKMLDALLLKYDSVINEKINELKQAGIDFNPEGQNKFANEQEAQEWFDYNYKDSAEVYAEYIAKYIEEDNDADTIYMKSALDYCAGNYTGVYNYVENGKILQKNIPFYNLIWDYRDNDKFNRNARFVGFREILTPNECFAKYPELTSEERQEIKDSASDDVVWGDMATLYNAPNLNWWINYPTGEKMVSVVTMFWQAERDMKYTHTKLEDGSIEYNKVKKNKTGEYSCQDIYKGTLIANKYLAEYGLQNNVVRNPENKSKPELPIKVYNGNTILGDGVSPIGLVAQSQDRIDFYRFKIIESMGRDAGKVYLINGNKLSESVTGKQLLTDFKTMGLSVVNSVTGESNDQTNTTPLVQTVDMTLDPNVKVYLEFILAEENWMEQALSVSKIAMGEVQPQLGKSVQQNATQLSTTGLVNFYDDFMQFNQMNLQYAANLAKIVYSMDGNFEAPMIVGDRGVRFLKIGKDFRFEDLLLYLKVKDVIGQADKERYVQVASAIAQQGGMDMVDFMIVDMGESKTQMRKDYEKAINKKKAEAAQMAEVAHQRDMQKNAQNIQGQAGMEQMRQEGEDARATERGQVAVTKTLLDHKAKTNQPQEEQLA